MSQSEAVKVLDLIRAPPTSNPYQHLKDWLLRMYALTDFAGFEVIFSLSLSGDMLLSALMSKMLILLPADHQAFFFFCGAFLQRLPSDVRANLVNDWISDPLSLAICADKIYRSQVSTTPALHHVSPASEKCPFLTIRAPPASRPSSQRSPTPGPRNCCSQPPA